MIRAQTPGGSKRQVYKGLPVSTRSKKLRRPGDPLLNPVRNSPQTHGHYVDNNDDMENAASAVVNRRSEPDPWAELVRLV
ncbi:MAG TPA: hypothetical protein DEG76_05310, partial [Pseudohongiella sp.]|nr:hypothetical protein [Pseudohongiella sp.]